MADNLIIANRELTIPTQGLVGHWPLDDRGGTAFDQSGYGNNGTVVDATPVISERGIVLNFAGNDEIVEISGFPQTTDTFTCVGWVYFDNLDPDRETFVEHSNGTNSGWRIQTKLAGGGRSNFTYTQGGDADYPFTNILTLQGQWQHFAIVKSGSAVTGYLDLESQSITVGTLNGTPTNIYLGDAKPFVGFGLNGKISDVHIYNRALAASEINDLYIATQPRAPKPTTLYFPYTAAEPTTSQVIVTRRPSTIPTQGLVGHWPLDDRGGTAFDQSGYRNDGTLVGDTASVISERGRVLDFDGTGDYVDFGDIKEARGIDQISVECWAKSDTTNYNNGGGGLVSKWLDGTVWLLYVQPTQDKVRWAVYVGNTGYFVYADNAIDLNWHHYVALYDGAEVSLYMDAIKQAETSAVTGNIDNDASSPVLIGSYQKTLDYFNGQISDVRIYNRALTASEINDLYIATQPRASLPTTLYFPYTAAAPTTSQVIVTRRPSTIPTQGLIGHWPLDDRGGTAFDQSGYRNDGTLVGTPEWVTTSDGLAVDFLGSDVASLPASSQFDFGTGPFTLSMRAKPRATVETRWGIYFYNGDGFGLFASNADYWAIIVWVNTVATFVLSDATINYDDITHVVGTRSADGVIRLYIDGVLQIDTDTQAGSINNGGSEPVYLGNNKFTNASIGTLSDTRIYNRALTASEVNDLYIATQPRAPKPTTLYFPYGEAGGGTDYTVTIDDGIGSLDALGSAAAFLRSQADDLGITDILSRTAGYNRTQADDLGITDILSRTAGYNRTQADDLGISDILSRTAGYNRTQADDLGISDDLAKGYGRTIANLLGISDTATRIWAGLRTVADDIGITDDMTKIWAGLRTIADDIGITDDMTPSTINDYIKIFTETVNISDTTTTQWVGLRTQSDTVGITDSQALSIGRLKTIIDTIGITDVVAQLLAMSLTISDDMDLTDTQAFSYGNIRSISDDIGITDDMVTVIEYIRTLDDNIGLDDAMARIMVKFLTIDDSIGITDKARVLGLVQAAWAFLLLKKHS